MPINTQLIFLFCFLCALAYVLFGILQMVLPTRALPIYRFFLGKQRYTKAEPIFLRMSRWTWRFVGAAYILFGMFVTWSLTQTLSRLLSPK
jgi:hypothetical protein